MTDKPGPSAPQTTREKFRDKCVAKIMDRCVHFTGVQHDACEAGIRYADVRDESKRPFAWPCFAKDEATTTCPLVRRPTLEEAEAEHRESEAAWARVSTARKGITDRHGQERGVRGEMPCPNACGGTLRYSIAGVGGHIHGQCSTKGCAAWME